MELLSLSEVGDLNVRALRRQVATVGCWQPRHIRLLYEGQPLGDNAAVGSLGSGTLTLIAILPESLLDRARGLLTKGGTCSAEQHHRKVAVRMMGSIGPAAAPDLADALCYPDVTASAAAQLGRMGAAAGAQAVQVAAVLREPPTTSRIDFLRGVLAKTLEEIGPPAVPSLVDLLGDAEVSVRERAARSLGKLGATAACAVPALEAIADAEGPGTRSDVDKALIKIRAAIARADAQVAADGEVAADVGALT